MIHVLLRIAVWVFVFGMGYLVFGPQLFDSPRNGNPFGSEKILFLPPVKAQGEIEYEQILRERSLDGAEAAEYQALVQDRQSKFWANEGVSVEQALADVKTQRKERLVQILQERGVTGDELAIFIAVAERDHAALLADRE